MHDLLLKGGRVIDHPAAGKTAIEGRPTAYVCRGPVCSLPVTDPDELEARLREG